MLRKKKKENEDEKGVVSVMAASLIWIPFSTLPMRLDCGSPPAEAPVLARE